MDIFDKVRLTVAIGRGDTHSLTAIRVAATFRLIHFLYHQ